MIETSPREQVTKEGKTRKLPPRHVRLCLAKQTRLLHREILQFGPLTLVLVLPLVIRRKLAFQKQEHVPIDLLEFEEEPIVSVGRGNDDEFRAGDVCREFALFGGREQAVCFDADDERSGREGGEDGGEGGRGVGFGGMRFDEVCVASPGEIVRVHFARDVDVTVGVEPGDELGALVAEIGLG